PLTSNLRHWHFSFRGAGGKGGMYNNGIYHGLIKLSKDYPMSPPDIQVWTPSGRFKPGRDICLSASAYHPEAWTPRWSIFGMVHALRLHMLSAPNEIGAMTSTTAETLEFARLSLTW
ncbi:UBC-like protein, partial [Fragilariopsis cylindrus CCMP1102]